MIGLRAPAAFSLLSILQAAAEPAQGAGAGDWPCWRGPGRDGVSRENDWVNDGRQVWRRSVGLGHSTCAVAEGRLYTLGFGVHGETDTLWCLDAETGEEQWTFSYPSTLRDESHGGGTLSTPIVERGRVWITSAAGEVRCLDAESGSFLWERHLAQEHQVAGTAYGFASSAVVSGELLLVNVGATFALQADQGATVWRSSDHQALYSTPALFTCRGQELVASFNRDGLTVHDLRSGDEKYSFPFIKGEPRVSASTPVVVGEDLFISSGYGHGCALVTFDEQGARARFENRRMRTTMSGCVLHGEHLYGFDESLFKCLDLDGEERWRVRGLGLGAFSIAGDRLILLTENGELVIARASPVRFEELHRQPIFDDGGSCWTAPVLCHGRLYLRNGMGQLICRDHRTPAASSRGQ